MMNQPIRVVVVDDSAVMRRIIVALLEQDAGIRVVGTAANGREAIALVEQLRPDIITLDVRMPVMDGLATTEHIMAYCPTPILVLTASLARYEVDITFQMLGAGALEVIEKPSITNETELKQAGIKLIRRIKMLSRVRVVTHLRGRRRLGEAPAQRPAGVSTDAQAAPPQPPVEPEAETAHFPVIVLGASTGGPRAIHQILSGLPACLPAAVLVVQHIAEGFSRGMVDWLAAVSPLPVRLAAESDFIRSGAVLVAPDCYDMLVTPQSRIHLSNNPLLLQRPAIDVTMQAVAEVYRKRAIGVLLTGMGRDGAYGMLTIQRAGGYTIAQDEASSTIFGMPRAAIQLNAATEILPAARIAARLVELVQCAQTAES